MSTTSSHFGKARQSPPAIAWRVWPLFDEGRRAWLLAAVVPTVGVAAILSTQRWYLALAAMVAVALALWRLWVPVSYELQPKGLLQTALGRVRVTPWKSFRRYEPRPDGVVLFASIDETPLDPLRGLYVPCGPRRDEVLTVLAFYLKGIVVGDQSSQRRKVE